jgi:hypothetical protein
VISGSYGGEYKDDCLWDVAPCNLVEVYGRFRMKNFKVKFFFSSLFYLTMYFGLPRVTQGSRFVSTLLYEDQNVLTLIKLQLIFATLQHFYHSRIQVSQKDVYTRLIFRIIMYIYLFGIPCIFLHGNLLLLKQFCSYTILRLK